jgi:hypothetical protein
MSTTSPDELEEFASSSLPPPDTREPTDEVVARARVIVDDLKGRAGFSTVTEGVDEETKLQFLIHVLEGGPFEKTYSLFDGGMTVTFQVIPGAWENEVLKIVSGSKKEVPKTPLYNRYLSLLSIKEIVRESGPFSLEPSVTKMPVSDLQRFIGVLEAKFSRTDLLLLEGVFKEYRQLLTKLLEEAQTPSFWPTPS